MEKQTISSRLFVSPEERSMLDLSSSAKPKLRGFEALLQWKPTAKSALKKGRQFSYALFFRLISPGRIRTPTNRTRICSATITQPGSEGENEISIRGIFCQPVLGLSPKTRVTKSRAIVILRDTRRASAPEYRRALLRNRGTEVRRRRRNRQPSPRPVRARFAPR